MNPDNATMEESFMVSEMSDGVHEVDDDDDDNMLMLYATFRIERIAFYGSNGDDESCKLVRDASSQSMCSDNTGAHQSCKLYWCSRFILSYGFLH